MSGKKTQHITLLLDKCLVFSSVVCHARAEKVNPLRRRAGWKEIKKASFKNNKAGVRTRIQSYKMQQAKNAGGVKSRQGQIRTTKDVQNNKN